MNFVDDDLCGDNSATNKEPPKEKQRRKNREYAQRSYALKGAKKKQKQEAKARVKRQCMGDEGRKHHDANTAARVRKSMDKMPNETKNGSKQRT